MSAADAAFDALAVLHPAVAFLVFVLAAAVLSTACERIAAHINDRLDGPMRRAWAVLSGGNAQ